MVQSIDHVGADRRQAPPTRSAHDVDRFAEAATAAALAAYADVAPRRRDCSVLSRRARAARVRATRSITFPIGATSPTMRCRRSSTSQVTPAGSFGTWIRQPSSPTSRPSRRRCSPARRPAASGRSSVRADRARRNGLVVVCRRRGRPPACVATASPRLPNWHRSRPRLPTVAGPDVIGITALRPQRGDGRCCCRPTQARATRSP